MNSRDRVLSAINHKEPDRVPIDLGGSPSSGISVVAYQNLIKHLGKTHLQTHVYDVVQEVVQPEMEFLLSRPRTIAAGFTEMRSQNIGLNPYIKRKRSSGTQ